MLYWHDSDGAGIRYGRWAIMLRGYSLFSDRYGRGGVWACKIGRRYLVLRWPAKKKTMRTTPRFT